MGRGYSKRERACKIILCEKSWRVALWVCERERKGEFSEAHRHRPRVEKTWPPALFDLSLRHALTRGRSSFSWTLASFLDLAFDFWSFVCSCECLISCGSAFVSANIGENHWCRKSRPQNGSHVRFCWATTTSNLTCELILMVK